MSTATPLAVSATGRNGFRAIDFAALAQGIERLSGEVTQQINAMTEASSGGNGSQQIGIAQMFSTQVSMNRLHIFSEMSTSVASAMHAALNSMARNIKG